MKSLIHILQSGLKDSSGNALASGTVTFYEAGTTTLATVYQDYDLERPHSNPATLDSYGKLKAYADGRIKLVSATSAGAVVETIDNVGTSDSDLSAAVTDLSAGTGLLVNDEDALAVDVDGTTISFNEEDQLEVQVSELVDDETIQSQDNVISVKNSGIKGLKRILTAVTKTTTYTATSADDVILCSTTGGGWTLTLPAASGITGKEFYIKKTTSDTNALTVDGNGAETIDGATTYILVCQYSAIRIVSDGSNWHIVSQNISSAVTLTSSSSNFGTTSTSLTDVTNLSQAYRVSSRPVKIELVFDGVDAVSSPAALGITRSTGGLPIGGDIKIFRDATPIYYAWLNGSFASSASTLYMPPTLVSFTDTTATPGTSYTYKMQVMNSGSNQTFYVYYCKLSFREV